MYVYIYIYFEGGGSAINFRGGGGGYEPVLCFLLSSLPLTTPPLQYAPPSRIFSTSTVFRKYQTFLARKWATSSMPNSMRIYQKVETYAE